MAVHQETLGLQDAVAIELGELAFGADNEAIGTVAFRISSNQRQM